MKSSPEMSKFSGRVETTRRMISLGSGQGGRRLEPEGGGGRGSGVKRKETVVTDIA